MSGGAAMLRRALHRSPAVALLRPKPPAAPPPARLYASHVPGGSQQQQVAREMIQYAVGQVRTQKSGESYDQALLLLEQGVSNLRGGDDGSGDDAVGMLMLAMSTLYYERGKLQDAVEKLQMVHDLRNPSLPLRVAAWEGLVGLKLEAGQDVSPLVLETVVSQEEINGGKSSLMVYSSLIRAVKELADRVDGKQEPGLPAVEMQPIRGQEYSEEEKIQMGKASLSNGECLHCTGNLAVAKDFYQNALQLSDIKDTPGVLYFAAANMVPEEVLLGATCALGQLSSHSGNFHDAEELLTKALKKAEDHFGSTHPKVGVILTCIALMFKRKAKLEASSSILIQEGLYRKAIDLLNALPLDSEDGGVPAERGDIIALARGGYADLLCIQENRKQEGERMRKWAEATWRNRRLSLAEALDFSEPSKAVVVDTRIFRVL